MGQRLSSAIWTQSHIAEPAVTRGKDMFQFSKGVLREQGKPGGGKSRWLYLFNEWKRGGLYLLGMSEGGDCMCSVTQREGMKTATVVANMQGEAKWKPLFVVSSSVALRHVDVRSWSVTTSKTRCFAPDVPGAIRHAPPPPLSDPVCEAPPPFTRHSGDESRRRSFHTCSNDTQTQNWHSDIDSAPPSLFFLFCRTALRHISPLPPSILGNVQHFQIRLSHQFLPVNKKRKKKE